MKKDKAYFGLPKGDRLLALSGVPINYLKKIVSVEQLNFAPASITYSAKDVTVIQSEYQHNFLINLLENISYVGESCTYAIGSFPTDQAAYQLATIITKKYYEYVTEYKVYPTIKWVDLGSPDWNYLKSDDSYSLLIVHGLSEASSDFKKLEVAKDFLRKCNATKIVLAVTANILSFAIMKLELYPDGVFQLSKTTNRVVI